jgi:hypothetical protein
MSSSLVSFFSCLFSFLKTEKKKEILIENYLTDAHVDWPLRQPHRTHINEHATQTLTIISDKFLKFLLLSIKTNKKRRREKKKYAFTLFLAYHHYSVMCF